MKATFSVGGDDGSFPTQMYEIDVCFNGLPGTVVLDIGRIEYEGHSGSSDSPIDLHTRHRRSVMRTALKASEARALASAILSAATEARN